MQKKVLVLTQEFDPHVPPVALALHKRDVEVLRFDLRDFPEHVELTARIGPDHPWQGPLSYDGRVHDLSQLRSVWYRRPKQYEAPKAYIPPVRVFLNTENLRGLVGVLQQGPTWVSRRESIQYAEYKLAQLAAAQALGLSIPRTLITNSPGAVKAFAEECNGAIISKAIARGAIDPEGVYLTGPNPKNCLYTNTVQPEHLEHVEGVRVCAHLFQQAIPKKMDLRIVVIGQRLFTIGIHGHTEHVALDWRRDYSSLTYSIEKLPQEVEQKMFQLVAYFGLHYSSADVILTPEGEYIFIELNPNGQFYFLQPPTGLPMAEAMADLLASPQEYGW